MNQQHPKAARTHLCINCKHHYNDGTGKFSDRCIRPENDINPVNGKIIDKCCENDRFSAHGSSCGPAGIYFVARIASANSCTAEASTLTP